MIQEQVHYSPPWADISIIAVAGSSGSGKSTLSQTIVRKLNLPWVAKISMDSFYKTLSDDQSRLAFAHEYDFDSPEAIDFDMLVNRLRDLKAGKRVSVPVYSFTKHRRLNRGTTIYSPHVLILEGIFALYDERVLELLDSRIYCEADADTCLSRRILRDVRERGRDIEGCIKQWFRYVKPNFEKYVEPQRKIADLIVPRGIENRVAIDMMVRFIEKKLLEKSAYHLESLSRLSAATREQMISDQVVILAESPASRHINNVIQNIYTPPEVFVFHFDRLAALIIEQALNNTDSATLERDSPRAGHRCISPKNNGEVGAVLVLRGGSAFESALRKTIPDCRTGRLLIQSDPSTGEPKLHFVRLPTDIDRHEIVLLLDAQMASGATALMAVQVLIDHGVDMKRIVFATYSSCRPGLHRLINVFPEVTVVTCQVFADHEQRWLGRRYFSC